MTKVSWVHAALTCLVIYLSSSPLSAQNPGLSTLETPLPNAEKTAVLSRISAATQRVWWFSERLSDGDISSALAMANYRKLEVAVMIGPASLKQNSLAVNTLRQQGINVRYRPADLDFDHPTMLLVDQTLYYYEDGREIEIPSAAEIQEFVTAFRTGKSSKARETVPSSVAKVHNIERVPLQRFADSGAGTGVFYYDKSQKTPSVVDTPRQLPKQPLYLKNRRTGPINVEEKPGSIDPRFLNPMTARQPMIRSPKSPESY